MRSFLKFRLLLWKNFLIQKRKPVASVFELGLPALFSLILMVLRLRVSSTPHPDVTTWPACTYTQLDPRLSKTLAFTPDNEATRRIMGRVNMSLGIPIAPFPSEDTMVSYIILVNNTGGQHINNSNIYLGGIVFDSKFHSENGTLVPDKKMHYTIRFSYAPRIPPKTNGTQLALKADTSWSTNFMFPPYQVVGPRKEHEPCSGDPGYKREGFLAVQHAIDDSLMYEYLSGKALQQYEDTKIVLRRHPYPPYTEDKFVLVLQQQFPLVIILSIVVLVLGMVRDIVLEKERRLKESMKMMGIDNWLHWLAWFTKHIIFLTISIAIMTLFFCITLDSNKGAVISRTNPFIIFLYLLCYSIATITFCFAVSVFFAKANTGAAVGGILYFTFYIPYFFLQQRYPTLSLSTKIVACLDFQVAMSFGGTILGMFEGVGSGIQFSNMARGVSVDDYFSMAIVIGMMLVDSVLHLLVAWYVETAFPGEYGVAQPWYFPVLQRYWCCSSKSAEVISDDISMGQNREMFEKDPNETAGIKIRNLRKVYGRGSNEKVAVAGMTLNMYEGQITALLGHNGAGKTTTMSMLTGFYPATSGTAIVNGYDIRHEISQVRSSLGLCPQHDILFDSLTVKEHMIFFGLLKGVPKAEIIPQCEEMLRDMELFPKLDTRAKALSGGMKRKLSVCIALIGNSKIVFLDEPSSGLDPNARRNIWTVLQKNRAGRTMVLSTHFMDEADLLGDRIAIMADGIVKCCGSSLFLKKKYGAGYHMVVVKDPGCDVRQVTDTIKSHISQAEMESNVGAELSYCLPQNSVDRFEHLFIELEERQQELGISSFGVSVTTMEEVFLKVGESEDVDIKQRLQNMNNMRPPGRGVDTNSVSSCESPPIMNAGCNPNGVNSKDSFLAINSHETHNSTSYVLDLSESYNVRHHVHALTTKLTKHQGMRLYVQQFYAMLLKRILHTLRNKLVTVTQLVVPLFFTVMGIIVLKTLPSFTDMPALDLHPKVFDRNYIPYALISAIGADMGSIYAHQFHEYSYIHTINVNALKKYNPPDVVKYLADKGKEGIAQYNLRYQVAASFANTNTNFSATATAYFNNQGYHSIAISLSSLFNGLLQYFTNSTDYSILTVNKPLPRLTANKIEDVRSGKDFTGFTMGFNLTFGMAFLASSFVLFLVKERSVKAKHIQFVSGVHPINFWVSTFLWDLINFIIPCLCLIITFFIFSIDNYTKDLHFLELVLFFVCYGWAMLPYMYFFSFAFTVPSTAYVWITMFNIITGVATLLIVVILTIPQIDLQDVSRIIDWIFLVLFPNYCLSKGMFDFYENAEFLEICRPIYEHDFCPFIRFLNRTNPCCLDNCGDFCLYYNSNYLGWEQNGIGRMLVFLTMHGIIMWGFIFASEYGLLQKLTVYLSSQEQAVLPPGVYQSQLSQGSMVQEDDDVARERSRIDNTERGDLFRTDKLVLHNLTKYYGSFRAVDHLTVGIPAGECFGLLGINGAGKTSTFQMITGDSEISSGDAFLDSYSLKTQKELARKRLGYCPQFDALIDQLTGREILTLFARLRGIRETDIPEAVDSLMRALTLTPYADKQCQTYSGGNKRKLSTAIALIGDPEVVFLDEPTTGMDPVARRMLWEVLSMVRDNGRTLVLTSHSMEECEALCTRLAIMVNGQYKCLGSIQHLKNKYGEGYTFTARLAHPSDGKMIDLTPLQDFINTTFPDSKLTDVHENMVNYHITNTSLKWAQIFGELERAKDRLHIEDYLISQTSLEQVFIYFARMQDSPDNVRKTFSCWRACCQPFSCCCNGNRVEEQTDSDIQIYHRMN